jgi:hypothetical protein
VDAFRTSFETLADYVWVKHGLGEALHTAAVQDAINETYAPVVTAVDALVQVSVADGSMRAGLDPADVLLLMGFLWRVEHSPEGRDQARRIMELTIEGLRPRQTTSAAATFAGPRAPCRRSGTSRSTGRTCPRTTPPAPCRRIPGMADRCARAPAARIASRP